MQKPAERVQKPAERLDEQKYAPSAEPALKRKIRPFMGTEVALDYREMYRAVFEYHNQYNPPQVDTAYWQQHKPGEAELPQADLDYWAKAAADMAEVSKQFSNDKFMMGLLCAVYEELERKYETLRKIASEQNTIDI